jgi:transposase
MPTQISSGLSMINHKKLSTDVLDHLGLVAATIDKLGIVKRIDKFLPMTNGAKTTMGQRAAAMIMNGLGFMDDRLYMFPKFLENKPVTKLLGNGLSAEDFNDAALGRFLDEVHEYGEAKLYSELALPIALHHNLLRKSVHFDTTSLSVYGEYEDNESEVANTASDGAELNDITEEQRLELNKNAKPDYGHAKNKRFDLKQMTLLLATTGAAGFPIWMESHSGNSSDKKTLEEAASRMQRFCKGLESAPDFLYVGDSAMYANCVKRGKDLLWLSRVPENMNISKELLLQSEIDWVQIDNGYMIYPIIKEYGNVKQRWLLVFSQYAYDKETETLNKNITKEYDSLTKELWHLGNQLFNCDKDIEKAVKLIRKKLKYHTISYEIQSIAKHNNKGRPKKDSEPTIQYKAVPIALQNDIAIANVRFTKGKFILATNQLDTNKLPDAEILPSYKEQSGTESGFKFIKDDAFELDSIFLKKPERISALMMVMTLCLMVYSYAQYWLRSQLVAHKDLMPTQSGGLTNKPSMKWVYRLFYGIHVLKVKTRNKLELYVLNLNELLHKIIRYFGPVACKIYDIESVVL